MTVKSIKLFETVDNEPDYFSNRGELDQGDTWTNHFIYKITNDDGSEQFLRIDVIHDSYGQANGVGNIALTEQTQKTVTVWK